MRKYILPLAIAIPLLCLLGLVLYNLPPVYDRLAWRIEALQANIKYAINPPEQIIFTPRPSEEGTNQTGAPSQAPTSTQALPASPTATLALITPSEPTATATIAAPPTLTSTPLPGQVILGGLRHEYQQWNNCGPANLAMALSFWGWEGNQSLTAAVLKPNSRDKNVMPYEMEDYVEAETGLQASVRIGGDLTMLKAFISSGYPVIVEKGFEGINFDGWMGHYQVVYGYDDGNAEFYVQDSYKGPGLTIPYEEFVNQWRAFNYTYLVIYPLDQREQVLQILGLQAYDNFNHHTAAQNALDEIQRLSGRDLYFAWFNRGSSLVALQNYSEAATAYDAAFANYPLIPEEQRPWRMLWYQTGPYFAYYYTARYQDVIDLATTTLDAMSEPILEESYYWRAKAKLALGQSESAIADLEQCLEVHPGFEPCVNELSALGIEQ